MTFIAGNPIPPEARLSDAFLLTHGVRFSSGSPYVAVVDLGIGHATSGTNGIGGSTPAGVLTYDRQFPIVVSFFDPSDPSTPAVTDFVSVRGDLLGSGLLVTLNAFDIAGHLIASFTTTDDGGETLSVSAPGIHSVQFLGTNDTAGVALDDLTFNRVTPAPCTLNVEASSPDGTLNLAFEVGTREPATWNAWLTSQAEIPRLFSVPLPVIEPPIPVSLSLPFFPALGTIGVLTTLTTPDKGIICAAFTTVDTDPPTAASATLKELMEPHAGEIHDQLLQHIR